MAPASKGPIDRSTTTALISQKCYPLSIHRLPPRPAPQSIAGRRGQAPPGWLLLLPFQLRLPPPLPPPLAAAAAPSVDSSITCCSSPAAALLLPPKQLDGSTTGWLWDVAAAAAADYDDESTRGAASHLQSLAVLLLLPAFPPSVLLLLLLLRALPSVCVCDGEVACLCAVWWLLLPLAPATAIRLERAVGFDDR